ncbi:sensor histidine kinase [Propionibacterium freudenreichii]|uniref:sensor histidine kinase n=1 Tax=Propionibacterium freudenreichii TaxID=1744 RepID=UPI000BC34C47|nr:sensor histidine kinase [Propionibacterium freudenreichii]MDK9300268.1 sensor histidine kinase [Propionibacterium freudenreichii]MDK9302729.1 sensor histidine kinase [Propionibacterium freudenreichii]MDK9321071.1 sensor histidine kinase [Propionibacterium freudenreichii]MDK9324928.1 sensor histidine kinase [Propionibacterium freudenreichii]MDK9340367.1 sensor histidine kinase [Propionibacterium freudenreichii]
MPRVKQVSDWFGAHPMFADSVWAGLIGIASLVATANLNSRWVHISPVPTLEVLSIVWALSFAIPMIWRRTRPVLACWLLLIPHVVQLVVTSQPMPGNITVIMMMYAVAVHGSQRAGRIWLGVGILAAAAAGLRWSYQGNGLEQFLTVAIFNFLGLSALVLASWLLGAFNRERHATVASLRDRAEALERERDRFTELAAEQERSRISREMHDVVAHSLSVIVVQTDGIRYALDQPGDPAAQVEQARGALDTIGQTARTALRDTRALVGALRDGESVEMAPQPQLDDIPQLVASTANSGLPVELTIDGDPAWHAPLGPAQQAAAYRIVQESLTNVIKHAGPGAHAWVRLIHDPSGLTIWVRDDGQGTLDNDGLGHGLIGMRERVASSHGTLTARNRLDGGFEVIATLPVGDQSAAAQAAGPRPDTHRRGNDNGRRGEDNAR